MANVWNYLVDFVITIARWGAGNISLSMGYEPEMPEELKK